MTNLLMMTADLEHCDFKTAERILSEYAEDAYDFYVEHHEDFVAWCEADGEEYSMCEYIWLARWASFVKYLKTKYC